MSVKIVQNDKRSDADADINDNLAAIAGLRIVGFNPVDGTFKLEFDLGDLTAIATGALVGDLLGRSGKAIKVFNAAGALQGTVTYDQLLNLQSATETQEGTAEIANQTEVDALTDDSRITTPKKLGNGFSISLATNGHIKLPSWLSGFTIQWGTYTSNNDANQNFNFDATYANACFAVVTTSKATTINGFSVSSCTASLFTVNREDAIDGTHDFFMISVGH